MAYLRSKRHRELFKKDGSANWWCFLPNPNGGRKVQATTGQTDEQAAYLWYLAQVRSLGRPDKEATTLRDALKRRRDERHTVGRAAGTIRCIEQKSKQLLRIIGGDTALTAITARVVDDYVARRLREQVPHRKTFTTRSTIYKELVALRGALKLARRQGYACPAVEEVMPLDFSPQAKPRERALSEHEIGLLLSKLAPKRAAVAAFILATGATFPSELEKLRRADIDTAAGFVRLRGTKRETRDRKVPIVSFARAWLDRAMAYYPFERWTNVRRDLHAACDAAGIARCSPNDLRRSVATLLRAKGVEPSLIGTYLGHADSRMAERVYGRLAPEQLAHLLSERLGDRPAKGRRRVAA